MCVCVCGGDCPFLHFMEKRVKTKEKKLRVVPGTKRGVLDLKSELFLIICSLCLGVSHFHAILDR